MKRLYFNKSAGKEIEYKEFSDADWEADTRSSNMNIDFTWWEKGCKSVVNRSVKRGEMLDKYLELVAYAYRLPDGQVRILKAIYEHRKWWGLMELTDEFETEMSKLVSLGRIKFRMFFGALAKNKKLMRNVRHGTKAGRGKYIVNWDVLATPMEMKNCEFVMMSFKIKADDSEG